MSMNKMKNYWGFFMPSMVKITKSPMDLLALCKMRYKIKVICGDYRHFYAFKVEAFRQIIVPVKVSVEAFCNLIFLQKLCDLTAYEVAENGRKVKVYKNWFITLSFFQLDPFIETCLKPQHLACGYGGVVCVVDVL